MMRLWRQWRLAVNRRRLEVCIAVSDLRTKVHGGDYAETYACRRKVKQLKFKVGVLEIRLRHGARMPCLPRAEVVKP